MRAHNRDGSIQMVKDPATQSMTIKGAGSSLQAGLQTKLMNQFNIQVTYLCAYLYMLMYACICG